MIDLVCDKSIAHSMDSVGSYICDGANDITKWDGRRSAWPHSTYTQANGASALPVGGPDHQYAVFSVAASAVLKTYDFGLQ